MRCSCLTRAGEPHLCLELRRVCMCHLLPFLGGLVVGEGLACSFLLSSTVRVVVLQSVLVVIATATGRGILVAPAHCWVCCKRRSFSSSPWLPTAPLHSPAHVQPLSLAPFPNSKLTKTVKLTQPASRTPQGGREGFLNLQGSYFNEVGR
jgi:hypothetical protein